MLQMFSMVVMRVILLGERILEGNQRKEVVRTSYRRGGGAIVTEALIVIAII